MAKKKKVRRRKSPLFQKMLNRTNQWRQEFIANKTGIAQDENSYEILKRFVANGETEYESLVTELEQFREEERDTILRKMLIKDMKGLG